VTGVKGAPPDGTREGNGVWRGGLWYLDFGAAAPPTSMDEPMMRTHHEAGSAEETYSRQMRFDKYLAMQQLLMEIMHCTPDTAIADFSHRAADILAGMKRPLEPAQRAATRAEELEALAFAYRVVNNVGAPGTVNHRAAQLTVEALKAWERAHPPAALDPLLIDRT
jgi:hypothetical protein